ncbi:MAG: hypothetical protein ACTSP3_04445 [Candidatus Heimdallarchaeaceae archaeon]
MSEDLFQKVGFRKNPFSPMGVTRGLDEKVPPPVGIRNALTTALKKLKQSVHYHDNMLLAVIGEYGSGKSELMKYLFRLLSIEGIECVYTQFRSETLNLYSFLKKNTVNQKKDGDKHERLIIFIDEIDDIPRMINSNQITKSDADRFIKDIRRFLERNDKFINFKTVMLVLGLGTESWRYISTYHPDISDSRLKGFRIHLSSPEDWKMTGLIRRYIYYYASEELKTVIDTNNPFYPFEEGTALALARLSALAHEHIYVNTRMLIKVMNQILLYLANETIKQKKEIIIPFSLDIFKSIINNPEILELNEPDFEDAIRKIRDSLKSVSEDLSKQINLNSDVIYELLFRIYFNHKIITDDEIRYIVGERMEQIIKERLIEAGVVESIYYISYENNLTNFQDIIKEIELNENNEKYSPIFEIRKYSTYTDNELERNNYEPTAVPIKEYNSNLGVKVKDINSIDEKIKEIFTKEGTKVLIISRERWEREIKEKQFRSIEISGETKALQLFENEKPLDLIINFAKNLRRILENSDLAISPTDDKKINDIVCAVDSPKNAYVFVKSSAEVDLLKSLKNYMKYCIKSKETFEAITFLIPSNTTKIAKNNKQTEMLEKELEKDFISKRDFPKLAVFNFPLLSCIHVIYSNETSNERNHETIIKEAINWVRDYQLLIREEYYKENRLPMDSRKYKKKDLSILRGLIQELWELILANAKEDSVMKIQHKIEKEFGDIFSFNSKQKISLLERDLIEILSLIPSKITNENSSTMIHRRFALSCSVLNPVDLLGLLEIKGLVINIKKAAVKNYEFYIYRPEHFERKNLDILKQEYTELNEYMRDLQSGQIEFQNDIYPYSIKIQLIDDLNNIQALIYNLDKIVDEIESSIPPIIKEITGQDLIEIYKKRQEFENEYEKIKERLKTYEKLANNFENDIIKLVSELREIENVYQESEYEVKRIIEKQIYELPEKLQNIKTEKDVNNIIDEITSINRKLSGVISTQKELQQQYQKLEMLCDEINNFLVRLEQFANIEIDIWGFVFNYNPSIMKTIDEIKELNPQELEKDYILSELPKKLDVSLTYLQWFEEKTRDIGKVGEQIIRKVFNEALNIVEPIKNTYEWIKYRKSDLLPKEIEKNIRDIKVLYDKLKSERVISGEDIKLLHSVKQDFNVFIEKNFGKHKEIVYEIGKHGALKAIDFKSLKEKFKQEDLDKCLQFLISKELVIQSYTT